MAGDGSPPYTIAPTTDVLNQMKAWAAEATRLGLREWYAAALRFINDRLTHHPAEWGDPLFTYRHLELQMFQGNHEQFLVIYGVHAGRRIVYLRAITRLTEEPFGSG